MNKLVLYADDDADDRSWVSEACASVQADLMIHFVENGREVLDYLQTRVAPEFPSLIILDLNMPQLDGRRTLQLLKTSPLYRHIPVAIVSTSTSKIDQDVCLRLGASLFLVKPNKYQNWQQVVAQFIPLVA